MLVDDTDGGFLRADTHALDVVRRFTQRFELCVNGVRSLDGGLSVEFGGVGDLEEDVLHNVGAKRHLELEWLALIDHARSERDHREPQKRAPHLEQDVVEAPSLRGEHGREAEFALLDE